MWCSRAAVLHHTANTRGAFTALARTVAPGGSFYVWLYWPVPGKLLALKLGLRPMISRLPTRPRYALVLALASASDATPLLQSSETW